MQISSEDWPILCKNSSASMPKLVEAENEGILVEVENGTWYNPFKGYGLRHSPFCMREMLSWREKAESILNWLFQSAKTL